MGRSPSSVRARRLDLGVQGDVRDHRRAALRRRVLDPKNEGEQRRLLDHVKALGTKVTRDLLGAIKFGGP